MASELLAIIASLGAAVAWGSADFGGGLASRRMDSLRVVFLAQIIGMVALLGFALAAGHPFPPWSVAIASGLAGLAGGIGLLLLYQALAIGPMGVVAPLTAAVSGILPVLVGIALEGWPAPVQLVGFVVALVAVWIIASPGGSSARPDPKALALSVLSGIGFAIFLTVIARLNSYGAFWPLVAARAASIALLALMVVVTGKKAESGGAIPWVLIAMAGLGDTAGNVLFVASTQLGRLDVAAVISSLYPAATVLLARFFLDERLSARQIVGVVLALIAIALIAL